MSKSSTSSTSSKSSKSSAKATKKARPEGKRVSDLLRLPAGPVDLAGVDTRSTPGFSADKADGKAALDLLGPRLADLQERLFAEGRTGGTRSVLELFATAGLRSPFDPESMSELVAHARGVLGGMPPSPCGLATPSPANSRLAADGLGRPLKPATLP